MEIIEKKYRDTPESSKKHAKRLIDYINLLLSKDRLLEAKYYFYKLHKIKPSSISTVLLGYKVSIKTLDNQGVGEFDRKLFNLKRKEDELYALRLQYYYSVNNKKNAEQTASYLLSKYSVKNELFQTIYSISIYQESYMIVQGLCEYMKRKKIKLDTKSDFQIKKVAIKELLNCLCKIKK